jgi:peptide-methionine (S)-S-oxide reductase
MNVWKSSLIGLAIIGHLTLVPQAFSRGLSMNDERGKTEATPSNGGVATLGGGCFWCLEAVFEDMEGVKNVVSGYSGGSVKNPAYEAVCSGETGHAEVVQIEFDPRVVGYDELLDVFFTIHDPTTANRQGADVGTQYRSVIFYHDDRQKEIAEKKVHELESSKKWRGPIVTEIVPLDTFYGAEDYHQDYFKKNPHAGYCQAVVAPKVLKFREFFPERVKD